MYHEIFLMVFYFMKKIIFGITCIISVILLIKILRILFQDFSRLTEYGFGYLTGMIILFLILSFCSILIGRKIFKKN